jgi:hypothetical protein
MTYIAKAKWKRCRGFRDLDLPVARCSRRWTTEPRRDRSRRSAPVSSSLAALVADGAAAPPRSMAPFGGTAVRRKTVVVPRSRWTWAPDTASRRFLAEPRDRWPKNAQLGRCRCRFPGPTPRPNRIGPLASWNRDNHVQRLSPLRSMLT